MSALQACIAQQPGAPPHQAKPTCRAESRDIDLREQQDVADAVLASKPALAYLAVEDAGRQPLSTLAAPAATKIVPNHHCLQARPLAASTTVGRCAASTPDVSEQL